MFIPHEKKNSLTALLNLLSMLEVDCKFANLTVSIYTRGYEVTLKGSDREKNISDHRKKEFKF